MIVPLLLCVLAATATSTRIINCNATSANLCQQEKSCTFSCVPDCAVFAPTGEVSVCGWLRSNGYDTSELRAEYGSFTLKISSVGKSDSGMVKRARLRTEIFASKGNSHIYPYKKFSFIVEPSSQMVQQGESVTLTCDAEGNSSISYAWLRSQISNFATPPPIPTLLARKVSKTLVIKSAAVRDTGLYVCQAKESLSGDTYWSSPAKLEVLHLANVTTKTENRNIASGRSIESFTCSEPSSYPSPEITWYRRYPNGTNVEVLGFEKTFFNSITGTLYLINVDRSSHEGTFECWARNEQLNKEVLVMSVSVTVSGDTPANKDSPRKVFFEEKAATEVKVGDSLTLRCAAYGNPIPSVYWTFGDSEGTLCKIPSSRYTSFDNGRKVVIEKVKAADSEFIYQCEADNGQSNPTKMGSLRNVGEYRELSVKSVGGSRIQPPYNSNSTVACEAEGSVLLKWNYNGNSLTSSGVSEDVTAINNTALRVPALIRTHGVYTCVAISNFGTLALRNIHTTVPVLPVAVYISSMDYGSMSDNSVESAGDAVERLQQVTCTASGFPPPRLYWYEDDKLVQDNSRYCFSLDLANSTIINTTLNISTLTGTTDVRCVAVSQTEGYTSVDEAVTTVTADETEKIVLKKDTRLYYIIGATVLVAASLLVIVLVVGLLLKKERKTTKPIRSYIKTIQKIQHDEGTEVSTKKMLQNEFKYAAHLHDILKTMKIGTEGDIESFREVVNDWANETDELEDSDFARRFRQSFMSKRGAKTAPALHGNKFGAQFRMDLDERPDSETRDRFDSTPDRPNSSLPIGRAVGMRRPVSPRRASNPIYAPLPSSPGHLRDSEL